jgi:hypothetical protein
MDISFLKAMAQDEGVSKISAIEERLGLSHGYTQTYRRRLLDAGVIVSARRGELSFVLPQMREYLRRVEGE